MIMQDIRSLNFEPLRSVRPELANMGGHAEHYAHSDPEGSLVKLRSFAEHVVDHIYIKLQLPRAPQSSFVDLLNNGGFKIVAPELVLDKLHLLRKLNTGAVSFVMFGNPPEKPDLRGFSEPFTHSLMLRVQNLLKIERTSG